MNLIIIISKFTIGSKLADWVSPQRRHSLIASRLIFVLHVHTSHTATCLVMDIYVENVRNLILVIFDIIGSNLSKIHII